MGRKVTEAILALKEAMETEKIDPTNGLGNDLFLFSTTLTPCVTIDLLIHDRKGRLLLAWRDDVYNGKGWHFPGGCVRLHESLEERVQRSAVHELGSPVIFEKKPLKISEDIITQPREEVQNKLERSHNISFLYLCEMPDGYVAPDRYAGTELQWFDHYPENMLETHIRQYGDILERFYKGEWNR